MAATLEATEEAWVEALAGVVDSAAEAVVATEVPVV